MNILIAGANGTIGSALGAELHNRGHHLLSISRGEYPGWSQQHLITDSSSADSLATLTGWLSQLTVRPECIIQCSGILHQGDQLPEKALAQVTDQWLINSMRLNLLSHLHLAQAIDPLVNRNHPIKWISVSARVGSIGDNALGGWYSYRMSKAALNMLVRNLSIEWRRKSPNSIAISLHPGTTDSELSQPFQKNLSPGKLYSPATTAQRLANIAENLTQKMNGQLINWDGQPLPY